MRLQGKRNRGKEEVKFLEIKGDDQLSGHQQWITKSMSEEKQTRGSFSKVQARTTPKNSSSNNQRFLTALFYFFPLAEKGRNAHRTTEAQAPDYISHPPGETVKTSAWAA